MDAAIIYKGGVAAIFETKNEAGTGGCDSYLETVANYVKTMNPRIQAKSSAPCFLIEIVGTHLAECLCIHTCSNITISSTLFLQKSSLIHWPC